tara:strand:- start:2080 stop:2256 length:177 start_codon:yes stop_codon:yes gene_type:complete
VAIAVFVTRGASAMLTVEEASIDDSTLTAAGPGGSIAHAFNKAMTLNDEILWKKWLLN